MNTDYKKLCIELFGTDNIDKLKDIAKKLNYNRGAGRKPKLTKKQLVEIEELLTNGMTMEEIAQKYNTSRQIIDKYVNTPPPDGYTLRMKYMNRNKLCTIIDVDFENERVQIKNRTDDIIHRAFGVVLTPTWHQFQDFLEDRCFQKGRGDAKSILRKLELDCYDPLQIVEKTKGRIADDNMHLKIQYFPRRSDMIAKN